VEKRKFSRVSLHAPAYISGRGKTYAGEVDNVSHGGIFVKTFGDFATGEQVLVSVNFHEGDAKLSVTVPGKVARQTSDGVAVLSPHIDTHSLIHFEYLLATNIDKREKLMEDFIDYVSSQQERQLI
jgi:hypothetical protein